MDNSQGFGLETHCICVQYFQFISKCLGVYEYYLSTFQSRKEIAAFPKLNYPLGIFCRARVKIDFTIKVSGFGGLEVACWPLVPKFAGSNPAEAVGFFRGQKNPLHAFLRKGSKAVCPIRMFAACKRTRKCMRGIRSFRSKLLAFCRPTWRCK